MLPRDFYTSTPLTCARLLLGCHLHWQGCEARIVETEAYDAVGDPACHTFSRPSARAFIANHPPGTAYVYLNYGIHWLFNVLIKGGRREGFVLIRAVDPLAGIERMLARTGPRPARLLGSGPGRLTKALGIDGSHHGFDLCSDPARTISQQAPAPVAVERTVRVGISRGRELPWRFLLRNNPHGSRGSTKRFADPQTLYTAS